MTPRAHSLKLSVAGESSYVLKHYVVFLTVYCIYGYQVCPYLDDLTLFQIFTPAYCAVMFHFCLRAGAVWVLNAQASAPRTSQLFWLDLISFSVLGFAIAAFNFMQFSFPPISGAKVLFAFAVLGYFISVDIALRADLQRAKSLQKKNQHFDISEQFMPYQTRFVLFSIVNIAIVGITALLVALKDLIWARNLEMDDGMVQAIVLLDISCVMGIVFGYNFVVIRRFGAKISYSLSEETRALEAVKRGELSSQVTVFSNDEFGHLASLTNLTIRRLRALVEEVSGSRSAIIRCLVSLSSKRDEETGLHLVRTQIYTRLLAEALQKTPKYQDLLTPSVIETIVEAAPLHDIGKVGIPDAVLRKPGKLTDEEFVIMKTHAALGAEALEDAELSAGGNAFLRVAAEIARSHHEKWDGSGYPSGLSGEAIPLSARIMAVSDVYDALRSKRVYKAAKSHSEARKIILDGAGSHFDPDLVEAFLAQEEEIKAIAAELSDGALTSAPAAQAV